MVKHGFDFQIQWASSHVAIKSLKTLVIMVFLSLFQGSLNPCYAVSQNLTAVNQNPLPFEWVRIQVPAGSAFINSSDSVSEVGATEQIVVPVSASAARSRNLNELLSSAQVRDGGRWVYRGGKPGVMDLEALGRAGKIRILDSSAQMAVDRSEAASGVAQCDGSASCAPPANPSSLQRLLSASSSQILASAQAGTPPAQPRPLRPPPPQPAALASAAQQTDCSALDPSTIQHQACVFSNSPQVKAFISDIKAHAVHSFYHQLCKRWVREALERVSRKEPNPNKKLVKNFGLTTSAVDAAYIGNPRNPGQLEQQGWKNLLKTNYRITKPSDAPCGAILVYATSWNPNGHIEVHTCDKGSKKFSSDFGNPNAFTHNAMSESFRMYRRVNGQLTTTVESKRLVGVFIKPDL